MTRHDATAGQLEAAVVVGSGMGGGTTVWPWSSTSIGVDLRA